MVELKKQLDELIKEWEEWEKSPLADAVLSFMQRKAYQRRVQNLSDKISKDVWYWNSFANDKKLIAVTARAHFMICTATDRLYAQGLSRKEIGLIFWEAVSEVIDKHESR